MPTCEGKSDVSGTLTCSEKANRILTLIIELNSEDFQKMTENSRFIVARAEISKFAKVYSHFQCATPKDKSGCARNIENSARATQLSLLANE